MEIDIASAIEEILDRRETVSIVGIGSLLLENLSAKLSKDGKSMSPPSAYLTFFDTQTKNKPLRKYLAKKYDISKVEAEKAISKFSKAVLKTLNKNKRVNIRGILKFEKNGVKVKMTPLKGYQSRYYNGLAPVAVSKLNKKTKEKSKDGRKKEAVQKEVTKKTGPSKSLGTTAPKFKVKVPAPAPNFGKPKLKETKSESSKPKVAAPIVLKTKPKSVAPKESISKAARKSIIEKPKSSISEPVIIRKSAQPDEPIKVTPKEVAKPLAAASKKAEPIISKTAAAIPLAAAASAKLKLDAEKPKAEMNLNDKLKQAKSTIVPKQSTTPATASSSPTASTTNTSASAASSSLKTTETTKPLTTKASYTPVPPAKEGIGCLWPILGLLGILLLCLLFWKGCNYIMGSDKSTKSSATELLTDNENEDSAGTTSTSTSTTAASDGSETDSGSGEVVADQEECIIITGVFSDYRNVKSMEEKLLSHGHNVYSEEYGPHTRVGFRFDCSDVDMPEYLHKIRAKFAKKAWYLEPELYVEYR